MSCFILSDKSFYTLGHTLADILNACEYGNTCTIATNAAQIAELSKAFSEYFFRPSGYNGNSIAEDLHLINVKSYLCRYGHQDQPFPFLPDPTGPRSLYAPPVYGDRGAGQIERPQPWHYHFMQLLDCFLYQTDEDFTHADALRQSLVRFASYFARQIVQHSELYTVNTWGE